MARPVDSRRAHLGAVGLVLLLLALFAYISPRIVSSLDYANSDFFSLWLAARMAWSDQDPYDPETWIREHQSSGADWISDEAFLYPLGLALLLAPLGLLPLYEAYVVWVFLSLVLVLGAVLLLLNLRRSGPVRLQYGIPFLLGAFAFRPVIVTIRNGQLGALLLILVVLALWMWERDRWLIGGVFLGVLLVKPSLGALIGFPIAAWTVLNRSWNATLGLGLGAAGVLGLGWLRDPSWLGKYLEVVTGKASATLGYAPSLWGWVGLACADLPACVVSMGLLLSILVLAAVVLVFLRRGRALPARMVVGLAISAALLAAPYIWAYDQILLLAPVVLMAMEMTEREYPYLTIAPMLLLLSLAALLLLVVAPSIGRDAWSASLSLLALAGAVYLTWHPAGVDSEFG